MDPLRYCPECGTPLQRHRVGGELRNHGYCGSCDMPHFDHPRVVVTCFVACGDKLLWVQRALEPKRGLWAIPGGFMERGETLAGGAARELREETGVVLPVAALSLYMTGAITFINQLYVAFRASVASESCLPGTEALACNFFSRDDCPWDGVAYPEVNDCIEQAYDDLDSGQFSIWEAEMTSTRYELRAVRQSVR